MRLRDAALNPNPASALAALEYCFARYRTCRALATWTAARILGDKERPRVKSARELIEYIERRVMEMVDEELGDKAESVKRQRARALLDAVLRTLIVSLASHYEEV